MARVKRGTIANKRRRNTLKMVKGYRFGRSTKERMAKDAIYHAGASAFRDRKRKKRLARGLWSLRINAEARKQGLSYSKLMGGLKAKGITLDRKVLSTLAKDYPEIFARVIGSIK